MAKKKKEPEVETVEVEAPEEIVEDASDAPAPAATTPATPAVTPMAATVTHKIVPSTLNVICVQSEDEMINGTIGKFDIIFDTKTNDIYRLVDAEMAMKNDSIGVQAIGSVKTLATAGTPILKKLA